ncbi:hypothetical protein [Streptomyces europaeiscabiei]|uniref:hypothetical protein n=1 Tax=Streptomyces europaeiscabiei TaxID=146819 RepID=UPI0029A25E15|nr:hypothetical protein [Streptomyces europaeiscabiei]MDX3712267.1 hypothetical protein [Streptomyces europaeiscabiei]MDX3866387.1 hypothetical protein [Streptomyces europaeiscabiei]MDX3876114.1 hypothetical protein [Streptomyces europaeiscabiei]
MEPVEVRMHGVGDHAPLSALGSGTLEHADPMVPCTGVDCYIPPLSPEHPLQFVNWSRTSRGIAGFAWYLATPFTLMNVVGHMAPQEVSRRRRHSVITHLMSAVFTIVLTAWLIATVETVLEYVPGLRKRQEWGEVLATFGPAVVPAAVIVIRAHVMKDRRIGRWLAWGHAICCLGVATAVLFWKPSRRVHWSHWPNSASPGSVSAPATEQRLDAMIAFAVVSVVVFLVLAALQRTAAAAVVALLTLLMMHAAGALIRLGVEWLMKYLDALGAFADHSSGVLQESHLLRTVTPPGQQVLLLDLVPVAVLLAFLGFALAFACSAVLAERRRPGPAPVMSPAVRRWNFVHNTVTSLPERIGSALWPTAGVYVLMLAVLLWVALKGSWGGWPLTVTLVITHVAAVMVLAFMLMLGSAHSARKVFGMLADVAGFWPICYHPLAGQSYREDVLKGLRCELAHHSPDRVVLFSHSQGSVLAAWLLAHDQSEQAPPERPKLPPKKNLHLITCGSPLRSLYQGFFPLYFDDAFFEAVRDRVDSWCNAWRLTDPIATQMPASAAPVKDYPLPEPDEANPRVHSNYWIESELTNWVKARLGGQPPTPEQAP